MQQSLILIWHRNTLACLYCSAQASRPARTDSSAKQKSIGLLAEGWGSTPSQTVSLCSRPVRHPSCEWTHCAHSASPCELLTSTHYVWRRQALIIRRVRHKYPFHVLRIQQLLLSCGPGYVLQFPFYSNVHRHSAIFTVSGKTRGDCCTCLWRWRSCIRWPSLLCYSRV